MRAIAKVPATSANLGAGFDTVGLALSIYNVFTVSEKSDGINITGCSEEFQGENNLVYTSMLFLFRKNNFKTQGFDINIETNIPECSGLGSSATCIVGGLIIANCFMGEPYTKSEILRFAIEIEGHGDNVTPAVLGSLTIIMNDNNEYYWEKVTVSDNLKFAVLTSDLKKESTSKLRESLPKTISLQDAIFNISHSLMAVIAFSKGDKTKLKVAMDDRLHEKYRSKFIENFQQIKNQAIQNNAISLNISGSGPSLIVIYDKYFEKENFCNFLNSLNNNWKFLVCNIANNGSSCFMEIANLD